MNTMIQHNKYDISVVIPIYNEEKIIPELYERLTNTVSNLTNSYELIFLNDGSRDHSLLELIRLSEEDSNVFFINFSRNFGHQIAVSAGLDYCRGKAVVIIDGDLQDPPEIIADLYAKYEEGFDVVYAKRLKRQGESFFKKITAKLFYRILKKMTTVALDRGPPCAAGGSKLLLEFSFQHPGTPFAPSWEAKRQWVSLPPFATF